MEKYLRESARTAGANVFHTELVPKNFVIDTLRSLEVIIPYLDQAKKGLMYGRDTDDLQYTRTVAEAMGNTPWPDNINVDLVHALLGILTEAGELGDLLKSYLTGDKTEEDLHAKLKDESGDVLWYQALLFRTLNTTFEEVGDLNTAKLLKRFPEKFTEDLAINRNESSENEVFQQT